MLTMYDSVTTNEIPAEPAAIALYLNGQYANYDEGRKLYPRARVLSVSVTGDTPADAYDIEHGDFTVADVPRLYNLARDHGVWRPCFYGSLDTTMPGIISALNTVPGMKREDIRLWVAYYNGQPDLPRVYDAHQFTNHALGRNLDESICNDTFFQPVKPPAPVPADNRKAIVTVNGDKWSVEPVA